jgi:hypothetical protein
LPAMEAGQKYVLMGSQIERIKDGKGHDTRTLRVTAEPSTPVRADVRNLDNDIRTRAIEARGATIKVNSDTDISLESSITDADLAESPDGKAAPGPRVAEPRIEIDLLDGTIYDTRARDPRTQVAAGTQFRDKPLPRAYWPRPVLRPLIGLPASDLMVRGLADYTDSRRVRIAIGSLQRALVKLGRKIVAQQHERAAGAVATLLVLVLGAVLSIHLRGGMTLVVFFWSFLLATVAIIVTSSGENVATNPDYPLSLGLSVVWMGNAVIAGVIFAVYLKLARN